MFWTVLLGARHLHMRLPPVYVTGNAILDAIAARQALRSGIASDFAVVAGDAGDGRALTLAFGSHFVHWEC
jgi:hypothetical protein